MPDALNDAIVTLAELRALDPFDGHEDRYPDELVLETRDAVIEALERECRVSFVRREHTETLSDSVCMSMLALSWGTSSRRHTGPVVSACAVNGIDLDDDTVTSLRVAAGGLVSRPYGAFGNTATITYEQGYDVCPGRVKRAVKLLTRDWLVEEVVDAIPSRATSWTAGDDTYRLVTAGVAGALFDLPEANVIVKRYAE